MLSDISHYEFTNAEAPVSGRAFGASMWPRLEEREWLNELVRTAECRGSFTPGSQQAVYSLGLGSKDSVATMTPEMAGVVDAVTRLNAVLAVPYYDMRTAPATTNYTSLALDRCNWYSYQPTAPSADEWLAELATDGLYVEPDGLTFTPGMFPTHRLSELLSAGATARATRQTGSPAVLRSAVVSLGGGFGGLFTTSGMAWARDDGTAVGPDGDSEHAGGPFLYRDPYGSAVRHSAGCYFKSAFSDTNYEWNNTYAYDGTFAYTINPGPWRYSNGARETSWSASVSVQVLFRVMHIGVWSTSSGYATWDKYYNQRYVLCPRNGGIWTIVRTRSGTGVQRPGTIKEIGDSIITSFSVSSWPTYKPLEGNGSVIGYQAYVEPIAAVLTANPAQRIIGT